MSSSYPAAFDALVVPSPTSTLGGSTPTHTQVHRNQSDAIQSVQATLGLNPQGGYTNVVSRLLGIEAALGGGGGSGGGGGLGYNVMSAEFGAAGTGLSTPLTAPEASALNTQFAAYGAQGAFAFVAGDERDYAAIQSALWKAAHTGRQVVVPAGFYRINKPLRLDWKQTPPNSGQPSKPVGSLFIGEGRKTILYGIGIGTGRGILELIGTANYYYAVDMVVSNMTLEHDASCNAGSYCIRAGDAWCGLRLDRLHLQGANGISLKVADSSTYAQLCTQLTQVEVWTNYGNRWSVDETTANLLALKDETTGALWDNVTCYDCIFRGQVSTRAWVVNFIGCQFFVPLVRPDGYNANVYIPIGSANFSGCYFEDHKYGIVALPQLGVISTVSIRDCHFSGTQNFGGATIAVNAILASSATYALGSVVVSNSRFRSAGYSEAAIKLVGCAYTITGCVEMDTPAQPVTVLAQFARGIEQRPNPSETYDVLVTNNLRPQFPIIDGPTKFQTSFAGEHAVTVENPNTATNAYAAFDVTSNGTTGRIVTFGANYVVGILQKVMAIFSVGAGSALTLGAEGAEALRIKRSNGVSRVLFGGQYDDESNQVQFASAMRVSGVCCNFMLFASDQALTKNDTRCEFAAACTITLPAATSWGPNLTGLFELHNRITSNGPVTVQLSGGETFITGGSTIKITPGETVFVRSSGGVIYPWVVARASTHRASVMRFVQTVGSAFANTTVASPLTNAGVGDLGVSGGLLQPGKTLRFTAYGTYSAVSSPTLTLSLKFGTTTVVTIPLTGYAIPGGANNAWHFEAEVTCRSAGAAGKIQTGARVTVATATFVSAEPEVTYDTTATNGISLLGQFSVASASNIWTCSNFSVVEVN